MRKPTRRACSLEGCNRPHAAKGLCQPCYYRTQRRATAWSTERRRRQGGVGYQRWRGTLLLEQGFACALCGETITAAVAHVDHVVPVSKGGGSEKANLQATCPSCNMRKGNRT